VIFLSSQFLSRAVIVIAIPDVERNLATPLVGKKGRGTVDCSFIIKL